MGDQVQELMDQYTKAELKRLAESEGATFSDRGTKTEIATEIVEKREAMEEATAEVVGLPEASKAAEEPYYPSEAAKELSESVVAEIPTVLEEVIDEEIEAAKSADAPFTETTTEDVETVTVEVELDSSKSDAELKEEIVTAINDVSTGASAEIVEEVAEGMLKDVGPRPEIVTARIAVKDACAAFCAAGQCDGPERIARRAAKAALYTLLAKET